MKKLVFLGACLLALASQPVRAQTGGATQAQPASVDVVLLRTLDAPGRNHIVLIRPGGKTEEIESKGGPGVGNIKESGLILQRLITELCQDGYTLKSTFTGLAGYGATLVFIKEK